jgi:hypothetical protein
MLSFRPERSGVEEPCVFSGFILDQAVSVGRAQRKLIRRR